MYHTWLLNVYSSHSLHLITRKGSFFPSCCPYFLLYHTDSAQPPVNYMDFWMLWIYCCVQCVLVRLYLTHNQLSMYCHPRNNNIVTGILCQLIKTREYSVLVHFLWVTYHGWKMPVTQWTFSPRLAVGCHYLQLMLHLASSHTMSTNAGYVMLVACLKFAVGELRGRSAWVSFTMWSFCVQFI